MKRGSTVFLKLVVFLIGIVVLALCVFGLPLLAKNMAGTEFGRLLMPILIGMYAAAIPFFLALYQALKLLSYIDKNEAFSELSVKALKKIKYCAIAISIIYVVSMPFFYRLADMDDAPGLIIIGMVLIFASAVIGTFAAVLQKLLQEAIDIKSENDLTV